MNPFEILGRKTAELDNLNAEYDRLLDLLFNVVHGKIDPKRVTVDLAKRTWAFCAPIEDEKQAEAG